MSKWIDMTGKRYGRLLVVGYAGNSKRGIALWKCVCDCGRKTVVYGTSLRSGRTLSCGCLQREVSSKRHIKYMGGTTINHGMCKTRIYKIWINMKSRCNNPKATFYSYYGGRGIKVCTEWNDSFDSFYKWSIEMGYNDSLTIDRIDNNGDYCPNNCRWATTDEQANNKSTSHYVEYGGQKHTIAQWAKITGFRQGTIYQRLFRYNWPVGEALGFEKHITHLR